MEDYTYIELTDIDVDGCGSDVSLILKVIGTDAITNGEIKRITDAIETYKKENPEEWDSDQCFGAAVEQLKKDGYKVEYIIPSANINF